MSSLNTPDCAMIALPYKRIRYFTQSKVTEFFIDVYYFNRVKDVTNLIFLLRRDMTNIAHNVPKEVKVARCREVPQNYEIVRKLKEVHSMVTNKLARLSKWIRLSKFANPHYRFLALSGLVPQRLIGNLVEVDKEYIKYKVLHSLLKELELDEIVEVDKREEILWRVICLKREGDKVLFLGGYDKRLDKAYSKLYEVDEGFREATDELLSV